MKSDSLSYEIELQNIKNTVSNLSEEISIMIESSKREYNKSNKNKSNQIKSELIKINPKKKESKETKTKKIIQKSKSILKLKLKN